MFGVAIKSGIRMKVSTAFAALQVLNMLRDPTRWLPFFIGMMMEFTVSMKRIQKFLQAEEINQLLIEYDRTVDAEHALSISNANFSWGGDKIQDTKDDQKVKEHLFVQKLAKKEIKERERRLSEGKDQPLNGSRKFMINEDEEESKATFEELQTESDSDDLESKEIKKDKSVKEIITLKNINLNIAKGEFICIIGEVGSGKSSLINALMGDLIYVPDEVVEQIGEQKVDESTIKELFDRSRHSGIIKYSGSVSYVQQVPWIQNKTLRDNILFGEPLDEDKYNNTIEKCQLSQDFELLDGGDLTEIGEKGINLSGGQKARVSLARAVYADRDIILMDDPISALDANTKRKIFDEVFCNELKDKTRILVTHAVDFLDRVDRIIIMDHCKVKYMGTYEELKNKEEIQHIIETLKHVTEKEQEEEEKEIHDIELKKKASSDGMAKNEGNDLIDEPADTNRRDTMKVARKMSYLSTTATKITSDEYEEKVEAEWGVYLKFFVSDWTWIAIVLSIPIYAAYAYCGLQSTRQIGVWITHIEEKGSYSKYVKIILLYNVAFGVFCTLGFFLIMMFVLRASNILHRKMVTHNLRAPINLYFDKTPTGKILNRFSKDINKIDSDFPFTITFSVECFSWVAASVFLAAIVSLWSLLCLPFVIAAGVVLIKFYIRSFREMTRIETVTNSPILSNFGETLSGTTTIR